MLLKAKKSSHKTCFSLLQHCVFAWISGMKLPTHLRLLPKYKMYEAFPPLFLYTLLRHRGSFTCHKSTEMRLFCGRVGSVAYRVHWKDLQVDQSRDRCQTVLHNHTSDCLYFTDAQHWVQSQHIFVICFPCPMHSIKRWQRHGEANNIANCQALLS